ncbi:hypothetical protein [Priestia megaterium]|uniref:hypothetical protein n=1 Tax=Priestia megaterium TaxID=1404 RepID=UPI002453152E|nr:hypothetical protein [Priestia megaterium]MDH3155916.1 hypothetical protein [Priestia megaterium]MED4116314.1 hypothetical protein [Priestia megaterium]
MIKKSLSTIGLILFIINVILILFFINGVDLVPDQVVFPIWIGGSILGLVLTILGKKGLLRVIGITGNLLFLCLVIIFPVIIAPFLFSGP